MIRPAKEHEAKILSDLAVRSKSYWPYDEKFIQDCKDDLSLNPDHIKAGMVYVYEENDKPIGYYGFDSKAEFPEMICLFVEPEYIGKGIGLKLWSHSLTFAKNNNWQSFKIVADPYAAENFYLKVGCKQTGTYQSPVREDRKLPLLEYSLKTSKECYGTKL
ncbi:MAG: GNAT family N-acetyltransferase [Pseudobdellovibrionaceae bacterium]|nr:MAG: GNAT family N-acetyltransferase [Pseudobdellovibrionaceae bacterium]